MGFVDDAPREHFETAAQWRAWLAANWATHPGVFVVYWRKSTGKPAMTYEEMVEQALCFGWVDSRQQTLDDERTMLWFTRRQPRSRWSIPNKRRIQRLQEAGLMHPAGQRLVDTAHADGSWTFFDSVDNLEVPPDLADEFGRLQGSAEQFAGFPPSVQRGLLEWVAVARTPATRARRVAEIADKAAVGERAHQQGREG